MNQELIRFQLTDALNSASPATQLNDDYVSGSALINFVKNYRLYVLSVCASCYAIDAMGDNVAVPFEFAVIGTSQVQGLAFYGNGGVSGFLPYTNNLFTNQPVTYFGGRLIGENLTRLQLILTPNAAGITSVNWIKQFSVEFFAVKVKD